VLRRLEQEDDDDDEDEGDAATHSQSVTSSVSRSLGGMGSKGAASSAMEGSVAVSRSSSNRRNKAVSDELGISTRRVTILSVNLGGLLKLVASATPALVQANLARAMDAILQQVNAAKGVVESVSGDHFVISLNASTHCGTHATRAAALILSLTAEGASGSPQHQSAPNQQQPHELMARMQIGCATAQALCGNFGSDKLRRFSVLGSVVNQAHHLMTRCRHYGVQGLVTAASAEQMSLEYDVQHVGMEALPHAPSGPRTAAAIVSAVLRKKEAANDEWMYQLEKQQEEETKSDGKADPDAGSAASLERLVNHVFQALGEGDRAQAEKLLHMLPATHPLKVHCEAALQGASES